MPKTTDIIAIKVGGVSLSEVRVGTTVVWPTSHTYTYVISDINVRYTQGASQILANANNYAYLTGTVVVYQDGSYYETLSNVSLTPVKVSGDSNLTVSGSNIVGTHRHTTQGTARTATFRGSYSGTQSTFAVTVTQQENQPTTVTEPMLTFVSTQSEIPYTGAVVPISYISKSVSTVTWTSGDVQEDIISDVTSTLSANIGTFNVDSVTGSGTVYLTVPANSSYESRSVVASMTYSGYSESVTFTQAAMEHPLEWYIDVTESPHDGYRDITIKNNYTSALSGYVRCDIYDEYGSFVTYTEISFSLAAGATKPATRINYGYGYNVTYSKHVN